MKLTSNSRAMNINKITIHNIASFEHVVIDFTEGPLADDVRFLICGPTGSGKSTILDAICLALYNTTPRLESAKNETYIDNTDDFKVSRDDGSVAIDDPRMLMRKGTAEAYVILEFTDRNDRVLVAEWSCAKARKHLDGKVQDVKWSLSDSEGNVLHNGINPVSKAIREAVGLTFDQFCRTTMLAQGEFTRFLKAGDAEKSEILEKLTQTGIYSLVSRKIHEKKSAKEKEMVRLKDLLGGIVLLTPEQIAQIDARVMEIASELSALESEEKEITALRANLERQKTLRQNIVAYKERLSAHYEQYVGLSAGNLFLQSFIKNKEGEVSELETWLSDVAHLTPMYENAGIIETLLKNLSMARTQGAECASREPSLAEELKSLEAAHEHAVKLRDASVREDAQRAETLAEAKEALEKLGLKELMEQKSLVDNALQSITEILGIETEWEQAKAKCKEADEAYVSSVAELRRLCVQEEALKAGLSERQAEYERQVVVYEAKEAACKDILKEYRSRLSDGDSCPLCGQVIAHLMTDEEFESVLEPERLRLQELKAALDKAQNELNMCKADIKAQTKVCHNAETSLKTARTAHENTESKFKAHPLYEDRSDLRESLNVLQTQKQDRKEGLEKKIAEALECQNNVDKLQKEKNISGDEVTSAERKVASAQANINLKKAEIGANAERKKEYSESAEKILEEVGSMILIENWFSEWTADEAGFVTSLKEDVKTWRDKCLSLQNTKALLEKSSVVFEAVTSVSASVKELCPQWTLAEDLEPCRVSELQSKWSGLLAAVRSDKDALENTENELKGLCETAAEGDVRTLEQLSDEFDVVTLRKKILSEEKGGLDNQILQDKQNQLTLGQRQKDYDAAYADYEAWARLYDIFGSSDGKKMRNIAQSYVLKQLLVGANVYLRQLTGRYELAGQSGSLTILLKDNQSGGVLRPTSTISGGESFLISLALALGLSSLSNRSLSMDILFIDEGFGTLDSDSLSMVMETLERLHQVGGRKVGIISHVESLRDSMTTQIQVTPVNSTLSEVKVVSLI